MAVPASFTTLDMSGKFAMNKELSDSSLSDKILELQGVGWIKRKAISAVGTPGLTLKHGKNDAGVEVIDIQQSFGKQSDDDHEGEANRKQILDWSEQHQDNRLFGAVVMQARRAKLDEMQDMDVFVREGWTSDSAEHGLVHVKMTSQKDGWTANHVWGIEEIKDERRHVRHIHFLGGKGEEIKAKFVYDYKGYPLDEME